MKIAVAQSRPVRGDIEANIQNHLQLIRKAITYSAGFILFPELSLTGYEPKQAAQLALGTDDPRLTVFQNLADQNQVIIAVGAPTPQPTGICISMLIFQPGKAVSVYSKQYLHEDETPYFVPGPKAALFIGDDPKMAPAICYELSIQDHIDMAVKEKARIYLCSVAKTSSGLAAARDRLGRLAAEYGIVTVLANFIGDTEEGLCPGGSALWNEQGWMVQEISEPEEGLILYGFRTKTAFKITI